MARYLVSFAVLQLAALLCCALFQRVDRTLEEGATGEDVVTATVNKIAQSGIFKNDFQFLKRMAYVETNFTELGEGGIWGINEDTIRAVSGYILYIQSGKDLGMEIKDAFDFNWTEEIVIDDINRLYNHQKMNVPLYSALAVMIHISIGDTIQNDETQLQAMLWKKLFKQQEDTGPDYFIQKVNILEAGNETEKTVTLHRKQGCMQLDINTN